MGTTKAVAHRVRRARGIALRAQLALTLTQLLLWVSLIGGVVGVALLWARRRHASFEAPSEASSEPSHDERHVDDTFAPPAEPGNVQQDSGYRSG